MLQASKYLLKFSFIRPILTNYRKMSAMPLVYVRHIDQDNTLKITFFYGDSEIPDRNFTFMRPKEEKLESALMRIKNKIHGHVLQKLTKKKKKKNIDAEDVQVSPINITLTKDGEILKEELKNTDAWISGVQVKINDIVYEISENAPEVTHLSLPKCIMSGFLVYPKVSLEFCSVDDSIFRWYRLTTKVERDVSLEPADKSKGEFWVKLADGFFYAVKDSDVGYKLRISCIPKKEDKVGIKIETIAQNAVSAGPGKCPFEDRFQHTNSVTRSGRLRCVSYNILADLYADSDTARNDLFPYCPEEALALDYRKQLYIKELTGYNGDLICLQEVDRKVFHDDLCPVTEPHGLKGVLDLKGGQVAEGLACFYRTNKFKVLDNSSIILSEAVKTVPVLQSLHSKILENEKFAARFFSRTTSLQMVLLESLEVPGRRLLVGNTHLYFHPESDNIRLMQAACCVSYLEHMRHKYQKQDYSSSVSVVLMGDFNSCPEFGVYELMTKGSLSEECADWKSNPEEVVTGPELSHTLLLASACGTPTYTNYTEGFVGCLDYIFYDKTCLSLCEVVPFPTHAQVTEHKALPSIVFPSDHLALVCTLAWK
ncbi:2',5'-phosphodiesterase 12-like [Uloborus diversus]|uniref:2',5'-phosphodiesterase 12-like n=1 Tax=Uloborus diversus TaxID=327109 RepID=UPI00240A2CFE|nr:2',5'-phosphodiesterase 12-like [Uloborus diversus]